MGFWPLFPIPLFGNPHKHWQGRQDSNLQPAVLETAALPLELLPCVTPLRYHAASALSTTRHELRGHDQRSRRPALHAAPIIPPIIPTTVSTASHQATPLSQSGGPPLLHQATPRP